jgi:hypothetical protein
MFTLCLASALVLAVCASPAPQLGSTPPPPYAPSPGGGSDRDGWWGSFSTSAIVDWVVIVIILGKPLPLGLLFPSRLMDMPK